MDELTFVRGYYWFLSTLEDEMRCEQFSTTCLNWKNIIDQMEFETSPLACFLGPPMHPSNQIACPSASV